jgi:hypothetical protein
MSETVGNLSCLSRKIAERSGITEEELVSSISSIRVGAKPADVLGDLNARVALFHSRRDDCNQGK